jgi:hypothetical protein
MLHELRKRVRNNILFVIVTDFALDFGKHFGVRFLTAHHADHADSAN